MSKTTHSKPISIPNCTHACNALLNTNTSRGNATRRTSPELFAMAPMPKFVTRAKKFQGNNAASRK